MDLDTAMAALLHQATGLAHPTAVFHEATKLWSHQSDGWKSVNGDATEGAASESAFCLLADTAGGIAAPEGASPMALTGVAEHPPCAEGREPLDIGVLSHVARAAGRIYDTASSPERGAVLPTRCYALVAAVSGLPQGSYLWWPRTSRWVLIQTLETGTRIPVMGPARASGLCPAILVLCASLVSAAADDTFPRRYRNTLVQAGAVARDLVDAAAARNVRARLVDDFLDDRLGRQLGLDGFPDQPLIAVAVGPELGKGQGV